MYVLYMNYRAMQLYWNTRCIVLLGGFIIALECILTYLFANNVYVIIFCSFGFFYGIGGAVAWTPSIVCVMGWFVEHKGIITGILMNGVTAGGICYSLIETLYINPNNIANEGLCGYALYPEVTQKVPGVFLLMAILTVVLTLVSATFTMDNPQIMANDEEMTSDDTEDDETSESFECSQHRKQYTIEEALRSTQFWMIFGNVLCNLYVGTFVFADWRVFAENYLLIQNDAFLLNLDIAAAIMNSLGRLAWGFILDYTKSYRLTMCMATSILCVLVGTLPLCSEEIMLFIWICLLWFACSATYVIYPPTICNTFGDKYCAILCSFVMISTIAATSLQSGFFSLMQSIEIHEHHRWIAYCIAASCYAALSFLIAVNFGPPQIWPKHTRK